MSENDTPTDTNSTTAVEKPASKETTDLNQLLEDTQKKAAENWDLFLRTRAESDNIRRRANIDVENAHKYGIEKFAREILAVVDSLDQGLQMAGTSTEAQSITQGMQLTHKLLLDILKKFGVEPLNPEGETFDPSRHEALSTQEHLTLEANKVLFVAQKGFMLQDRVLRPARVIVSCKPKPSKDEPALENSENNPS